MWLILGSACSLSLAAGWRRASDAQATLRRLSFAFWTHHFDPSGTWMFWLKTCAAPSVCRLFIRSVIRRCLMCLVAHCKCMLQLRYSVCGNSQNSIHIKPATSAECSQPEASDRSSDRSARRPRGTKKAAFKCSVAQVGQVGQVAKVVQVVQVVQIDQVVQENARCAT